MEQLREWADRAGTARNPKKRRCAWQVDPDAGTVKHLRRLVEQECCGTLPDWERRLFRGEGQRRALPGPRLAVQERPARARVGTPRHLQRSMR